MVWKCPTCKFKWKHPTDKCIKCKDKTILIQHSNFKIVGITKVSVASPDHSNIPYYILLLKDNQNNFLINKTFKKYKLGQIIKKDTERENKRAVGIVGTGVTGIGIAQVALLSGAKVILKSRERNTLSDAGARIKKSLLKFLTVEEIDEIFKNRLKLVTSYADLSTADIVIESVIENMEVKKQVFKQIDKFCSDKTIFATNTSSLSVTKLASVVSNPSRFVGMHFFNPVVKMNLVEVIVGDKTSDNTIKYVEKFVKDLNKIPIRVKDTPGFIVNNLLFSMINKAAYLVYEGIASPKDIDTAIRFGANHPMGPLELADMIGIDLCIDIIENIKSTFNEERVEPCPLFYEMKKSGHLGRKTKRGFYEYQ